MLLKDYFIYLYYILKSEGKRVQRLFIIITLGSLLVFFIHFSTNIIKTKITQNYAGRYVLMPYLKNSQHLETSLPFELIKQEEIQLIQNTFIDTQILETVQNKEITLLITVDELNKSSLSFLFATSLKKIYTIGFK